MSSTFADMQAERDYLMRFVMPSLRARLEKHRVHLVDVDLRWGVTRREVESNRAVDVCLDWVQRARPFFVGILGHRYGFVPELTAALHPERSGLSVTELEIQLGALSEPARSRAVFAIRADAAVESIPEPVRSQIYVESIEQSRQKLSDLKARIRRSGLPVVDGYQCTWTERANEGGRLAGLESFGDDIERNLWEALQRELELESATSDVEPPPSGWLSEEEEDQERFVRQCLRAMHGRAQETRELAQLCARSPTSSGLVTGPSGIGKSSVLASAAAVLRQEHSDIDVVSHFVGAGRSSTSLVQVLTRLCTHLAALYRSQLAIPEDLARLCDTFEALLGTVPAARRLVVVLDGLDQLDTAHAAHELQWLPRKIPEGVFLLCSCTADENVALEAAATEWASTRLALAPLRRGEVDEVLSLLPSLTAKALDEHQKELLLDNAATGNPQFLAVALEELRGSESPAHLEAAIHRLPSAADALDQLLGQALAQAENTYGVELTTNVLCALHCARSGLSESELSALMASIGARGELMPLLRHLRPHLVRRGALLDLRHSSIKRAIVHRYLANGDTRLEMQRRLVDFFFEQPLSRQAHELPWQLRETNDYARLYLLLTDPDLLNATWESDAEEVIVAWRLIQEHTPLRLEDACAQLLKGTRTELRLLRLVTALLAHFGHVEPALESRKRLVAFFEKRQDRANLATELLALAQLEAQQGLSSEARSHLEQAEAVVPAEQRHALLAARIFIHSVLGDQVQAENALKQAEASPAIEDRMGSGSLSDLRAIVLKKAGKLTSALAELQRAQRMWARLGQRRLIAHSKNTEGQLLRDLGRLKEAEECHRIQLEDCRNLGERRGVALALSGLAYVAWHSGEHDDALRLHEEARQTYEAVGDRAGVGRSNYGLAAVHNERGNLPEAISFATESARLARATDDRPGLVEALRIRGEALDKLGTHSEAQDAFGEASKILEQLGDPVRAAMFSDTEATMKRLAGHAQEALDQMRQNESVFRRAESPHALATNLLGQCAILIQNLSRSRDASAALAEVAALVNAHGFSALLEPLAQLTNEAAAPESSG